MEHTITIYEVNHHHWDVIDDFQSVLDDFGIRVAAFETTDEEGVEDGSEAGGGTSLAAGSFVGLF